MFADTAPGLEPGAGGGKPDGGGFEREGEQASEGVTRGRGRAGKHALLDDVVRPPQQQRRDREAERLSGLAQLPRFRKRRAEILARYTRVASLSTEIGRASCRGRGEISVVAVSLKKKKKECIVNESGV